MVGVILKSPESKPSAVADTFLIPITGTETADLMALTFSRFVQTAAAPPISTALATKAIKLGSAISALASVLEA
jgi:hypothetical protein